METRKREEIWETHLEDVGIVWVEKGESKSKWQSMELDELEEEEEGKR